MKVRVCDTRTFMLTLRELIFAGHTLKKSISKNKYVVKYKKAFSRSRAAWKVV